MSLTGLWHPKPAPAGFAQDRENPDLTANIWARTWISYIFPLLKVGYSRPLEENDLWQVNESRRARVLGDRIESKYEQQIAKRRRNNNASSAATPDIENGRQSTADPQASPPSSSSKDLQLAVYYAFLTEFWTSGALKLIGDVATVTTPLVSQAFLTYLTKAYLHQRFPESPPPQSIGYGFGMAAILFVLQVIANFTDAHFLRIALNTGIMLRTAMSALLFRKSLRLSNKSRQTFSKGRITTMLSADAPRLERAYMIWIAPIQIIVAIALLINLLGYSALVGLGVIIFSTPVQSIFVALFFRAIRKNIIITDARVKLMQEVLQGIRSIKMYAWEEFYMHKIAAFRTRELSQVRKSALLMSLTMGFMTLIPVLCTTLTFVTYSLTGHTLSAAKIFAALQLFNILRVPLLMLPAGLSILAQTRLSLDRMNEFLEAEEAPPAFDIDDSGNLAVSMKSADFAWEALTEDASDEAAGAKPKEKEKATATPAQSGFFERLTGKKTTKPLSAEERKDTDTDATTTIEDEKPNTSDAAPFSLRDIDLQIHRGDFVAVVGRVASGKTSLLQAIAGEMKKTKGNVSLGGTVAYVPQTPWIVNASVRQNILFGETEDSARYNEVIRTCSLQADLDILQFGDRTEIGEKGINLSGGQRARVSLARAAYSSADIVLFDDPISALDAHVGKAVIDNCLVNGPLSNRTRILVTHALHVLPHVDYVYVLDQGRIVEHGSYRELLTRGGELARLIDEFGSSDAETNKTAMKMTTADKSEASQENDGKALMQDEDRATGGVPTSTYIQYFQAAGGAKFWILWILALLTLAQAAQVGTTLFLGFWTSRSIDGLKNGHYIAIYIAIGLFQTALQLMCTFSWAIIALRASYALFAMALSRVMSSPVSFFDTTPMGRIVSRLTKDVAALDSQLWNLFDSFFSTAFSVFGTIALVFYTFPYLGIIFVPLYFLYEFFLAFYRRTSVEVKRLDSVLRSYLYSSYIETMDGISTVRATRQEKRFIDNTEDAMDIQNRASFAQFSILTWLTIRLNLCGNVLIFGIALFGVGYRLSVDPSKVGVVLTYTLSTEIVTSFAAVEQGMNSAERMIAYGDLPQEGASIPDQKPAPSNWPTAGTVEFKNVTMAYREGLPDVLHGVSFTVNSGEKIGIVGRTGAGKSSLSQALLRLVETRDGAIEVDGVNIQSITLKSLRQGLSIIPQDSLFLGTLRENIDPMNTCTDAELISILQRAHLLPAPGKNDPAAEARFTLDANLGQEGTGLSAGERQQLALCRVLVKQSRIVILDEATSSVDVETDSKLQATIRADLSSSTLLCIAHRLNTIAGYDRVLVMDRGTVAEFDTPLNLFDRSDSIFRGLCGEAGLSRDDIVRIRAANDVYPAVAGRS
ncbi:cadmium ion transporter [Auriculariales sp. MPI-PUGE-AT-0066]|nr:cadmium ion transporter [Auriculariales sp. MPI-PUGE-AT-0066]